jgi:hypothetical protein
VKMTVIGRPRKVVAAQGCVITVFQSGDVPPDLPKGLPRPTAAQTPYAVFIADKQWRRVEASLQEHEEDELIIEGYPVYEPRLQGMAVLAQRVTTKLMEQARKAKRQEKAGG